MSNYEFKGKYDDCNLYYKLEPIDSEHQKYFAEKNKQNYEKVKEALGAVGVYFDIKDDILTLSVTREYVRIKSRVAGRRKRFAYKGTQNNYGVREYYRYSDVVFMLQTMKDHEIAEALDVPIATYYRHKKKMKESNYYKSLDLNKALDKKYLESVDGNYAF